MSQQNFSTQQAPKASTISKDEKAPSLLIPMFKLPLILYRLRMGWMLGKRFMQITHVGRRSGKTYKTILAVLKFDDKTQEIYAVSAWKGSDWYYNIQAAPALQVETKNGFQAAGEAANRNPGVGGKHNPDGSSQNNKDQC